MSCCSQREVRDPKQPRGLHFPPHRCMEEMGLGSLSAVKYKTERVCLYLEQKLEHTNGDRTSHFSIQSSPSALGHLILHVPSC